MSNTWSWKDLNFMMKLEVSFVLLAARTQSSANASQRKFKNESEMEKRLKRLEKRFVCLQDPDQRISTCLSLDLSNVEMLLQ